jgi:hypothetical protein
MRWRASLIVATCGVIVRYSTSSRTPPTIGSSNRIFGLVFATFFLVVAGVLFARGNPAARWSLIAAVVFAGLAFAAPGALTWPNRAWTKLGEWLHRITSPIALLLVYALGIVPAGFWLRLRGKDPLRLKLAPSAKTYWIPRVPPARGDARMKRQF